MAKRTFHRGALVGVMLLVVLVLVILLVPTITAIGIAQVGNIYYPDNPNICTMADQFGGPVDLNEDAGEVEIFKVETPNAKNARDVVALLRCQANLDNDQGHAITYSGTRSIPCLIELDSDWDLASTPSWSQTISASGIATLTCQFKRYN